MADFNQLSRFAKLFGMISPGLDVKPLLAELKARVSEELDYTLEADAQRSFADAYADDPEIVVPRVVASAPKIVVSEWLDGTPMSQIIASGTQEQRNLSGRLLALLHFPRRSDANSCTPTRTRATSGCCPTAGSASSTSARSPGCPTGHRSRWVASPGWYSPARSMQ